MSIKTDVEYRPVLDLEYLKNEDRLKIFSKVNHSKFFFIEIGAYDGITNDPVFELIEKYNWRGILCEPLPGGVFKRLVMNHKDHKNLIFKNVAIYKEKGNFDFFYNGAGSSFVKRDNLTEEWGKNFGKVYFDSLKNAEKILVKTITWEDLVKEYDIKYFDFLHIDTEGMDYKIINEILKSITPTILEFESNLFYSIRESKNFFNALRKHDYKLYYNNYRYASYDCFAIQRRALCS